MNIGERIATAWFRYGFWIMFFIALGFFVGLSPAFGQRPAPRINCHQAVYPHVSCEAQYVYPYDAEFFVFIEDVRADYEKGLTVYITLPDDVWARIEVHVQNQVITFYGRWSNKNLQFRRGP